MIAANDVVYCGFSLGTASGQPVDQVPLDSGVPRVHLSAANGMPILVGIKISPLCDLVLYRTEGTLGFTPQTVLE